MVYQENGRLSCVDQTLLANIATGRSVNLDPQTYDSRSLIGKYSRIEIDQQNREAVKLIIVTTTPGVDGFHVSRYLGIESVEYVVGFGMTEMLSSDVERLAGQRLSDYEKKMRAAKRQALEALKLKGAELGANAVVGVDFDYVVFRGPRLGVSVNGTLVQLEPIEVGKSHE